MRVIRDHGGNLDAAVAQYGGMRQDWLDLSTGINPTPYPLPTITASAWSALPDKGARDALIDAARRFWSIPEGLGVLPVPGASSAIAHIPLLRHPGQVAIPGPTYNEHAASFAAAGWNVTEDPANADASVLVHPNNPDGRLWKATDLNSTLRIIDESFCDVDPDASLIGMVSAPETLILKSFGKFWGLAGVRLGFVIGHVAMLDKLAEMLGPWAVAGPALEIGRVALLDEPWANATRTRLEKDSTRLDAIMLAQGAQAVGGTTLFRLYEVDSAAEWQTRLATHHIWTRVFPYNPRWLRLGLPNAAGWEQIEKALA